MKKTALLTALVLAVATSVFAQGFGPGMGTGVGPQLGMGPVDLNQQVIKIEGKLTLYQGHPAVVTKTDTYLIRLPSFLYGFIGELKEGAQVKLEGYAQAIPYAQNTWLFLATKLTIAGKDYDLSQMYANRAALMPRGMTKRPGGRW